MAAKDSGTENHIKETAKNMFFKEGRYDATTQDIADAAGVNRTLLHYYFRSRDVLLEKVLLEGQMQFRQKMSERLNPELAFKEKISQLIDIWMEHITEYPYLDAYLVTKVHNGEFIDNLVNDGKKRDAKDTAAFFEDIEAEMKAGRLVTMEPMQFLLNLISMISYPLIMRPLLEKTLSLSKRNYSKIMADRKEAILKTLFP